MLSFIIALLFGCFSRSLNNIINTFHDRCLRMIYNSGKQSNFEELLVQDNSVSMHHRNIQRLAIQIFMVSDRMSPDITREMFQPSENTHYHLKHYIKLWHIQFTVFIMDSDVRRI